MNTRIEPPHGSWTLLLQVSNYFAEQSTIVVHSIHSMFLMLDIEMLQVTALRNRPRSTSISAGICISIHFIMLIIALEVVLLNFAPNTSQPV